MKQWLARARDLDRLTREVAALREDVSRLEERLEETARTHELIERLQRDREEDGRRLRDLDERLRDAEADHTNGQERLGLAIRKLQGLVDMQGDQLERTASGLLERIEATRSMAGGSDRVTGKTAG